MDKWELVGIRRAKPPGALRLFLRAQSRCDSSTVYSMVASQIGCIEFGDMTTADKAIANTDSARFDSAHIDIGAMDSGCNSKGERSSAGRRLGKSEVSGSLGVVGRFVDRIADRKSRNWKPVHGSYPCWGSAVPGEQIGRAHV